MKLAIDATVLILLQTKPYRWWGVVELADHMKVQPEVITDSLHRLEQGGGVQLGRVSGTPFKAALLRRPEPPRDLTEIGQDIGTVPGPLTPPELRGDRARAVFIDEAGEHA
jgi:hypothetical protein